MFGLLEQELPQHLAQRVGSRKPLVVSQPVFTATHSIIDFISNSECCLLALRTPNQRLQDCVNS